MPSWLPPSRPHRFATSKWRHFSSFWSPSHHMPSPVQLINMHVHKSLLLSYQHGVVSRPGPLVFTQWRRACLCSRVLKRRIPASVTDKPPSTFGWQFLGRCAISFFLVPSVRQTELSWTSFWNELLVKKIKARVKRGVSEASSLHFTSLCRNGVTDSKAWCNTIKGISDLSTLCVYSLTDEVKISCWW